MILSVVVGMPRETSPELALAVPACGLLASGCSLLIEHTGSTGLTQLTSRHSRTLQAREDASTASAHKLNPPKLQGLFCRTGLPYQHTLGSTGESIRAQELGFVALVPLKGCFALLLSGLVPVFPLSRIPNPCRFPIPTDAIPHHPSPFLAWPSRGYRRQPRPWAFGDARRRSCCLMSRTRHKVFDPFGKSKLIRGLLNVRQTGGCSAGCPNGGICCRGSARLIYGGVLLSLYRLVPGLTQLRSRGML
jgi:hypothetical protein